MGKSSIAGSEEEIRKARSRTTKLMAALVVLREKLPEENKTVLHMAIRKLALFDEMTVQLLHRPCACCHKWNKDKHGVSFKEVIYQCGRCKILELIDAEDP